MRSGRTARGGFRTKEAGWELVCYPPKAGIQDTGSLTRGSFPWSSPHLLPCPPGGMGGGGDARQLL